MRALILSFVAVILAYSLIFDEKKPVEQTSVVKDTNSVYMPQPEILQSPDSILDHKSQMAVVDL